MRMEFTASVLRPLEQARHDWYNVENLTTYFEVTKDVLLGFGVDIRHPNYDPQAPYSERILITRPERI
jgi:hypothetical protein